jgi:uncharacterized protein YyaL (SSP411 family)
MTSSEGPFYSTQDADSEGEEGKFYVWSAQEIEQVLGKDRANLFTDVYDVTPEGNWEGHNILHRTRRDDQDARMLRVPEAELRRVLEESRRELFAVRSRRVWPGRDEKALTAWNGLMIDAFAQAAQVLGNPDYTAAAVRAADFILRSMRSSDGRLFRTYSAGSAPKLNGYLEDYAFLLNALVSLYEATFDGRWIEAALDLTNVLIDQFWDEAEAGFFYTGRNHEALITRTKDSRDSSIPSGNSMAVLALLRLAELTGRQDLRDKAEATLRFFQGLMAASPMAAGQMLVGLDFCLGPVQEFVVIGDLTSEETRRALHLIRSGFRPNTVLAAKPAGEESTARPDLLPLLADKTAPGGVTTYICQNFACQAPLIGVEALEAALTR